MKDINIRIRNIYKFLRLSFILVWRDWCEQLKHKRNKVRMYELRYSVVVTTAETTAPIFMNF